MRPRIEKRLSWAYSARDQFNQNKDPHLNPSPDHLLTPLPASFLSYPCWGCPSRDPYKTISLLHFLVAQIFTDSRCSLKRELSWSKQEFQQCPKANFFFFFFYFFWLQLTTDSCPLITEFFCTKNFNYFHHWFFNRCLTWFVLFPWVLGRNTGAPRARRQAPPFTLFSVRAKGDPWML